MVPSARLPLIIDDVAPAAGKLTDLGKTVVGPFAERIQAVVTVFGLMEGWQTVSHDAFVRWSADFVSGDGSWLVLDPLFPVEMLNDNLGGHPKPAINRHLKPGHFG